MRANLDQFTVQQTDTIRTAMEKITANKARAVVVLDDRRVVGTVSDGDIRRAFLREVLSIAPVETIMQLNCVTTTETHPTRLLKLTRQQKVTMLPIINHQNELLDVFVAAEPLCDRAVDGVR